MTEIHLDDERLSAVVDGLADADDAAHAASCPECQARVQQWQRVVGHIGSGPDPAPDANRREAAIAAALAENVSGLEGARKRRRLRTAPAAGVAAAVLVVAGLAFGLSQVGNGASPTSSGSSAAATAPPVSAPSTSVGAAPQAAGTAAPAANLGAFDSPTALVAALHQVATSNRTSVVGPLPSNTCPAKTAADASVRPDTAPSFWATLTYQGQPSSVSVFTTQAGHVAVVERNQGCVLLTKVSYP